MTTVDEIALNDWLAVAPQAQGLCSRVALMTSGDIAESLTARAGRPCGAGARRAQAAALAGRGKVAPAGPLVLGRKAVYDRGQID